MLTLSFGSCIQRISGGGLPSTRTRITMVAPLSASIDLGSILNAGPSARAKKKGINDDSIDKRNFKLTCGTLYIELGFLMKIDTAVSNYTYS